MTPSTTRSTLVVRDIGLLPDDHVAATLLGISRATLYRKIHEYNVVLSGR